MTRELVDIGPAVRAVVRPRRIIMEWREKTTHFVRFFRKEYGFEHTFCGQDIAHDLRYVAPEGTIVTCMGCIAEDNI